MGLLPKPPNTKSKEVTFEVPSLNPPSVSMFIDKSEKIQAFDWLKRYKANAYDQEIRGVMGKMLFGGDDAFNSAKCFVQRVQSHQGNDGGAIRIRNDVSCLISGNCIRVNLRHHQRNILLITETGSIINDNATLCTSRWCKLF